MRGSGRRLISRRGSAARRERERKKRKGDQIGRTGGGLISIVALAVGSVDEAGGASRGGGVLLNC